MFLDDEEVYKFKFAGKLFPKLMEYLPLAPPCVDCKFWSPEFCWPSGGLICCHSEERFPDFSCFEEKSK